MPSTRDTLSVIHDLSRAVRNNPEAVDIYMALGNLFRSKGDIQHAVLIRERLMARPELNSAFKARASFELGQDYRRAGVVDRAQAAYREAARLGYNPDAVTAELANLFAESGSFEMAAAEYGKLGHYPGEAHYFVRAAEELARGGDTARSVRLLKKAAKVYPGSVEAWSALLAMHARDGDWKKTAWALKQALARVAPKLQFLLLEALINTLPPLREADTPCPPDLPQTHLPAPLQDPSLVSPGTDASAGHDGKEEQDTTEPPHDAAHAPETTQAEDARKPPSSTVHSSEYMDFQDDSGIPDSLTHAQRLSGHDIEDSGVLEGRRQAVTGTIPHAVPSATGPTVFPVIKADVPPPGSSGPAAPSASDPDTPPSSGIAVDESSTEPVSSSAGTVRETDAERRAFAASLAAAVIPVLEKREPAILLHYYGGLLFREAGDTTNAAIWFSKALVVQPHFWAPRLELLRLAARDNELSAAIALQVDCLAEELGHIKRFYCTACGLRQNDVFYRCLRCGSWHSISYRLSLQE